MRMWPAHHYLGTMPPSGHLSPYLLKDLRKKTLIKEFLQVPSAFVSIVAPSSQPIELNRNSRMI